MYTKLLMALMVAAIVSVFACAAHASEVDTSGKMRDVAACNDGAVYSNTSGRHQGACRGHKGVSKWFDGSEVKSKKASGHYRKAGDKETSVSFLDLSTVDPDEGSALPTIVDKGKL
jgi:hypothetical protein